MYDELLSDGTCKYGQFESYGYLLYPQVWTIFSSAVVYDELIKISDHQYVYGINDNHAS